MPASELWLNPDLIPVSDLCQRSQPALWLNWDIVISETEHNFFVVTRVTEGPLEDLKPWVESTAKAIAERTRAEIARLESVKKDVEREIRHLNGQMSAPSADVRLLGPKKNTLMKRKAEVERKIRGQSSLLQNVEHQMQSLRAVRVSLGSLYPKNVQGPFGSVLEPPICEVCQLAATTRVFERDQVSENLCEACALIRETAPRMKNLPKWEARENRLLWVRIMLDQDELGRAIPRYIEEWVTRLSGTSGYGGVFNSLSIAAEFSKDYVQFLHHLYESFSTDDSLARDRYGPAMEAVREEMCDVYAFKVFRGIQVEKVLDHYVSALKKYFPHGGDVPPVRFVAVLTTTSTPFFDVWSIADKPSYALTLAAGRRFITGGLTKVQALRTLRSVIVGKRETALLHRITALEREMGSSDLAVEVELIKNKHSRMAAFLRENRGLGITGGDILAYYKLALW